MIKFIQNILMKREAVLLDTPLFILKTFIAIMAGYALFHLNPLIGKDMISVLLGLMLTLQPVNISGLKSGWDQLSASLIGGMVTGIIVIIGGVNFVTVPLAVALTLYITLRINWRGLSVIAVFTSIYMTQFIQLTDAGEPSMLLTFRLRLLALGSGILIAVIVNFIFSLIFYRSMIRKRTIFILEKLTHSMEEFGKLIDGGSADEFEQLEKNIITLFGDIDFILGGLQDIRKKKTYSGKTEVFIEKVKELRDINHYILDMVMLENEGHVYECENKQINIIIEKLVQMSQFIKNRTMGSWKPGSYEGDNKNLIRIYNSFRKITELEH